METFAVATADQHFGGYVLEAELGILKELNSTLAGFFPESVNSTKIFSDLMTLLPETRLELRPRVTAYAKLDATSATTPVLDADHFAVKVTFAGVELFDSTYDFKDINVTASLDPITLDLESAITISTNRIVADNLPKGISLPPEDPDNAGGSDSTLPPIPVPTPVPWLNASVAGGYELKLDDGGYQMSLGLELTDDGFGFVKKDTWLSVDAKTTAAAVGQLNLGIGLFGVDLVGLNATATLEGSIGGRAVLNFDASGTPDYNEDRSNLNVDWDWSFDVETTTFEDWLEEKIDFVEDKIDEGIDAYNSTLDSLEQAVDDIQDQAEKISKTVEKWWLYEGSPSKISDEDVLNELTGNATAQGATWRCHAAEGQFLLSDRPRSARRRAGRWLEPHWSASAKCSDNFVPVSRDCE